MFALYSAFLIVASLVVAVATGFIFGIGQVSADLATLAGTGIALLLVPHVVIGAALPHRPGDEQDAKGSRARRRALLTGGLVQAVGAVVILVGVGAGSASPWPGIGLVAVVSAASVVTVVWARRIRIRRRADRAARPGEPSDVHPWRARRDRAVWRAVIGGVVAVVLGTVVAGACAVAFAERDSKTLWLAATPVFLVGCLISAVVLMPFLFRIGVAMRDVVGRDFSTSRAIPRAVLRGKDVELTPEQIEAADQYASLARLQSPIRSSMFILVFGVQVVTSGTRVLTATQPSILDVVVPVLFVAVVILWVMIAVVQARAVDRWQTKRERETAPLPAPG